MMFYFFKFLSNGVDLSDNEMIRQHVAQRHVVVDMSEANFLLLL